MAVDLNNYNPMYQDTPVDRQGRYVITAEEWSNLWALTVLQTNNTSEAMKTLLTKLISELWSIEAAEYIQALPMTGCSVNTVGAQLAYLLSAILAHKSASDHDSRYYTKTEMTQYLQGGDTSIGVEVFTIINADVGDGTFTYSDGVQTYTGTLTPTGQRSFELQLGEYAPGENRIEAIINDSIHWSAQSGGLIESDVNAVVLTGALVADDEVTLRYFERISLSGEASISYSTIQPPVTAGRNIIWLKLLD